MFCTRTLSTRNTTKRHETADKMHEREKKKWQNRYENDTFQTTFQSEITDATPHYFYI